MKYRCGHEIERREGGRKGIRLVVVTRFLIIQSAATSVHHILMFNKFEMTPLGQRKLEMGRWEVRQSGKHCGKLD